LDFEFLYRVVRPGQHVRLVDARTKDSDRDIATIAVERRVVPLIALPGGKGVRILVPCGLVHERFRMVLYVEAGLP